MRSLEAVRLLIPLSLRSLASHRVKTLIVGGILAFGTFLLALCTALLDNVESQMERSITGSLIGHMQILSEKAKDKLEFFGIAAGSAQDLGVMENFPKARAAIERLPGVEAVVPMGRDIATAMTGNVMDRALDALRLAVQRKDETAVAGGVGRIRQLATLLRDEFRNRGAISTNEEEIEKGLEVSERAVSDELWAGFEKEPLATIDWLDSNLAPLQSDSAAVFMAYIGTDLDLFARHFGKFRIVEGTMVPKGERGFMLSQEFLDTQAKHMIPRELDIIEKGRRIDGKTLADPVLKEKAAKVKRQFRRIVYELDPAEATQVRAGLAKLFGDDEADLPTLVERLLTLDEASFDRHYKAFYELVAPHIDVYFVRVGQEITLRAFTRSGYLRSANLKVYGTFKFDGLDGSLLASIYNLMDLMTYRDLYGLMTPERKAELEQIRATVGVRDVTAEDAEAALFGGGESVVADVRAGTVRDAEDSLAGARGTSSGGKRTFTQEEIDQGVVTHASIVLKPGASVRATMAAIRGLNEREGLGIQVIHWEQAAGMIGQFIWVMRIVLYVAFVIIFVVALAIINNSMLMATMDRILEIGTLRAIGAQRAFVLAMFLLETLVLGTLAAAGGVLGAWGATSLLSRNGIPAGTNDVLIVLFGGPRLYPHLTVFSIVLAVACIAVVSLVATLYPARMATRVAPVVAMQRRE